MSSAGAAGANAVVKGLPNGEGKHIVREEVFDILKTRGLLAPDVLWNYLSSVNHGKLSVGFEKNGELMYGSMPYKKESQESIRIRIRITMKNGEIVTGIAIGTYQEGFIVKVGSETKSIKKDAISFVEINHNRIGGARRKTHRRRTHKRKTHRRRHH